LQEAFSAQDRLNSTEIHAGLEKVFKVSEYLDFPFTLDEVANYFLPRLNLTTQQLRAMLSTPDFADLPFRIENGYILTNNNTSYSSRLEREQTSAAKLEAASEFARVLARTIPFIQTIAVTGSVAYGSATRWDDIDLFMVTKRNRLWLTAFMTLVLVRLNKVLGLRPPHLALFCLSYVHDEQGFANESEKNIANPLFARELLKAKPVAGAVQYRRILEQNNWVEKFYSESYANKLRGLELQAEGANVEVDAGTGLLFLPLAWAERIMFEFLSRYLRLRAYLTNLKLKSKGQALRVFEPKLSADSCVYTSNFYEWLRALWGQ
jgi:hypothetical protein